MAGQGQLVFMQITSSDKPILNASSKDCRSKDASLQVHRGEKLDLSADHSFVIWSFFFFFDRIQCSKTLTSKNLGQTSNFWSLFLGKYTCLEIVTHDKAQGTATVLVLPLIAFKYLIDKSCTQ